MNLLSQLQALVGPAHCLTDAADRAAFELDWRKRYRGQALAVVRPGSTEEVAAVVRLCAEHRVPIVPQGGNTGLVGGGVPDGSGTAVVLSLQRMRAVRGIDAANGTITVEAGCVLAEVQAAARAAGFLFPLSLAAEGSCTIGGNLATNAGGVQVLRYGNARELCLGLEVVTAQGEVWNGLSGLRKDNTGFDLRNLYIGSEGCLGVITAATMRLYPLPRSQSTALFALESPAKAAELLLRLQTALGPELTAFELFSRFCLDLVLKHQPGTSDPFAESQPWYALVEVSSSHPEAVSQPLVEAVLGEALAAELAHDAVLASSIGQAKALWTLREAISESQAAEGKNIKHDISVPISEIPTFIERNSAALQAAHPGIRMVVFGHLGDGNLHYNVSPPEAIAALPTEERDRVFLAWQPSLNRIVHDEVVRLGGSISAEHGVGQLKRDELPRYKSPVALTLMKQIKRALDPHNLMNPGKVL